jgi:hypothetical protein
MSRSAASLLAHDWARESRRESRESGLNPRAARSAFMNSNIFWLLCAAFVTAADATLGRRESVRKAVTRQIAAREAERRRTAGPAGNPPSRALVMGPLSQ